MTHTHAHLKEYAYTQSHPHNTQTNSVGEKKGMKLHLCKTFTEICLSLHDSVNMEIEHGNAWTLFIKVLRKKKQVGFFEFKANLVYMSSKLYGAIYFDPIKCEPVIEQTVEDMLLNF